MLGEKGADPFGDLNGCSGSILLQLIFNYFACLKKSYIACPRQEDKNNESQRKEYPYLKRVPGALEKISTYHSLSPFSLKVMRESISLCR